MTLERSTQELQALNAALLEAVRMQMQAEALTSTTVGMPRIAQSPRLATPEDIARLGGPRFNEDIRIATAEDIARVQGKVAAKPQKQGHRESIFTGRDSPITKSDFSKLLQEEVRGKGAFAKELVRAATQRDFILDLDSMRDAERIAQSPSSGRGLTPGYRAWRAANQNRTFSPLSLGRVNRSGMTFLTEGREKVTTSVFFATFAMDSINRIASGEALSPFEATMRISGMSSIAQSLNVPGRLQMAGRAAARAAFTVGNKLGTRMLGLYAGKGLASAGRLAGAGVRTLAGAALPIAVAVEALNVYARQTEDIKRNAWANYGMTEALNKMKATGNEIPELKKHFRDKAISELGWFDRRAHQSANSKGIIGKLSNAYLAAYQFLGLASTDSEVNEKADEKARETEQLISKEFERNREDTNLGNTDDVVKREGALIRRLKKDNNPAAELVLRRIQAMGHPGERWYRNDQSLTAARMFAAVNSPRAGPRSEVD